MGPKEGRRALHQHTTIKMQGDGSNDLTPVGTVLARNVASKLTSHNLMYQHRDYCGVGLIFEKDRFSYVRVYDGDPVEDLKTFEDEVAFVEWLSVQTNNSLHGYDEENTSYRGNQRLTLDQLEAFVLKNR